MSASNITRIHFDSYYGHDQDWNFIYNHIAKKVFRFDQYTSGIFMYYIQNKMMSKIKYYHHNTLELPLGL